MKFKKGINWVVSFCLVLIVGMAFSACVGDMKIDEMLGSGVVVTITPNGGGTQNSQTTSSNNSVEDNSKQSDSETIDKNSSESTGNTTESSEIEDSEDTSETSSSVENDSGKDEQHAHDWVFAYRKEPRCETEGEVSYICWCGENNTIYIPATGHDIISHKQKEPTCIEVGWLAYEECTLCSYTTYKRVSPLGHQWVDGVCTACGANKVVTDETHDQHIYAEYLNNWDGTHTQVCIECGWVNTQEHTWDSYRWDSNEQHIAQCVCEAQEYFSHTYQCTDLNNGMHSKHCTGCFTGDIFERHTYENGACLCGAVEPDGIQFLYKLNYEDKTAIIRGVESAGTDLELVIPDVVYDESSKEEFKVVGIAKEAFADYASVDFIKSVKIGKNIEFRGENAFFDNTHLTFVTIAEGSVLKRIGTGAFFGCPLTYIEIPNSIEMVESQVFCHCNNAIIQFDGEISEWYTKTASWVYGWTTAVAIQKVVCTNGDIYGNDNLQVDHVNVHQWTFYQAENDVGHRLHCDCGALGKLVEHTMEGMDNQNGTHLFMCRECGWQFFESRSIPHDLEYVNNNLGTHNKSCKDCSYQSVNETHIYVEGICVCGAVAPNGSNQVQPTWLEYKDNGNGTATITGIGSYVGSQLIIPDEILAADGVTILRVVEIGDRAFTNATYESVVIGKNVKKIGECAFCNVDNLVSLTLPAGLAYVGELAFVNCCLWKDGIDFQGTKAQWTAQRNLWHSDCYILNCEVRCIDGVIQI